MWRVWVDCPARTCVLDERDQADASAKRGDERANADQSVGVDVEHLGRLDAGDG